MAWQKVKLGDIAIVTSSKRFHLSERSDSGVPFYCSKQIIQKVRGELVSDYDYIREEFYENVKKQYGVPEPGDLLITTRGSYGVPYIYKDKDKFYFADGNLTWLKDFKEDIDVRFLYYWICSYEGQKKIDAIAKGTAQKAVTIDGIKNLEISVPSFKTQKRIADILSAYDNLIENNQKQIKLLEEAAQRLYKQWFIDLRYPGHETTPIIDGLPEGWRKEKLGNVIEYIRGTSYTSSELSDSDGVLMVNLKNINAFGGYKRNAEKRFTGKYKENGILESGDLVMGCTDMTKERRLVGHVALIPNLKERAVFTMDLLKILSKTISKTFLYAQCRFGGLSYKIAPLANGANVLHLRPENMADIEVLCPAKSIVEMYDNVFASMISKIEKLEDQIQLASESRNRLLPKLMNGELGV